MARLEYNLFHDKKDLDIIRQDRRRLFINSRRDYGFLNNNVSDAQFELLNIYFDELKASNINEEYC